MPEIIRILDLKESKGYDVQKTKEQYTKRLQNYYEIIKNVKSSWQEFNISKLRAKKILENVFTK